jgi:hypothetical protein
LLSAVSASCSRRTTQPTHEGILQMCMHAESRQSSLKGKTVSPVCKETAQHISANMLPTRASLHKNHEKGVK